MMAAYAYIWECLLKEMVEAKDTFPKLPRYDFFSNKKMFQLCVFDLFWKTS